MSTYMIGWNKTSEPCIMHKATLLSTIFYFGMFISSDLENTLMMQIKIGSMVTHIVTKYLESRSFYTIK